MAATKEVNLMKLEETRVSSMMWRRRLENKGMIEISQDRKTKEFVLVAAKGIRRKWLLFSLPERMWTGRGAKKDVLEESKRLLDEVILAD